MHAMTRGCIIIIYSFTDSTCPVELANGVRDWFETSSVHCSFGQNVRYEYEQKSCLAIVRPKLIYSLPVLVAYVGLKR